MKIFFTFYLLLQFSLSAEPFQVGELLRYKIVWKFMTVGYSTMGVPGTIPCGKYNCYIFLSTAKGTSFIDKFFPVEDRITSFWIPELKKPVWTEKNLNEGNFHKKYNAAFHLKEKKATWTLEQISGNSNRPKIKRKDAVWKYKHGTTYSLPDDFQDILSAVYYMRGFDTKKDLGQSFEIQLFDDLKLSVLKVKIIKQEELKLVVNGKTKIYNSIATEPYFHTSGVFQSAGNIRLWISTDYRRIPLRIQAKIPYIGSILVELEEDNLQKIEK
ncbi:MAG: DUF3108 domain-containing protein [Leptospiraceae bacterium]|nr:DUF3108 domain-containing protein [Leptospiraceae bacterium]MCK6380923.1 DUF3108 domain-containing protein [Leptospiraceae bacterium]